MPPIFYLSNDELASALAWVDDRLKHTGTGHDYFKLYTAHLKALLDEQLRRATERPAD